MNRDEDAAMPVVTAVSGAAIVKSAEQRSNQPNQPGPPNPSQAPATTANTTAPPGTPRVEVPELVSFRLAVDVAPDPTAVSMIAEPVPFASPLPKKTANPYINLPSCEKVIQRHVPGLVSEAYIHSHALQPPYPRIRPADARATFVARELGRVRLNVLGEDGKPACVVTCTAGHEEAGLGQWSVDDFVAEDAPGFISFQSSSTGERQRVCYQSIAIHKIS
jgi:hypothetical protein